ncbi:hypothetical protein ACLM5J_20325 [Nocardioides sp. Bht2]|uniref:hypothetical protein n=1 Tax=Nocardioides sp. Bht2 TaxID=3392297 RepID=UPI0039B5A04D
MLPAPRVGFLSLAKARDPKLHRAINEWHQLDHRPENLALEGVAHGERFVQTPKLAATAHARGGFEDFDYATLYWLDAPEGRAIEVWSEFAEQSFREGRRPDVDLVDRPYMDFFRVAGYLPAPGSRLNTRALHFLPGTGVVIIARALPADAGRSALGRHHAWELDTVLPALANVPGYAAGWVLQNDSTLAPTEWSMREAAAVHDPAAEIIRLTWIITEVDQPGTVLERILETLGQVPESDAMLGETVFLGAAETITPWNWSWFDDEC